MSEYGGGSRKRSLAADDISSSTNYKRKQKKGGSRTNTTSTTCEPPGVTMSRAAENCAPQINLSKDQLVVYGTKGFRMVRATHGVSNGTWYWECTVLPPETPQGHCRLGWSRRTGSLQAPVGYDKYSYAYRDIAGSKVHESLRSDNYGEPWGPGDVIGFLIKIKQDEPKDTASGDGTSESGRLGVDAAAAALSASNDPDVPGNAANEIRFFKNGEDQGVAFTEMPQGTYYPAVSVYMGGTVRVNMGPEFVYPPPSAFRCKPISSLKAVSKEETKAQRNRIKLERAEIGLEPGGRSRGSSGGDGSAGGPTNSIGGSNGNRSIASGSSNGAEKSTAPGASSITVAGKNQSQSAGFRSKSPVSSREGTPPPEIGGVEGGRDSGSRSPGTDSKGRSSPVPPGGDVPDRYTGDGSSVAGNSGATEKGDMTTRIGDSDDVPLGEGVSRGSEANNEGDGNSTVSRDGSAERKRDEEGKEEPRERPGRGE